MKSVYFKELNKFTISEFIEKLGVNKSEAYEIIKNLKYNNRNIIKIYKNNTYEIKYSFDFVGIITYRNFIFKCYPKYFHNLNSNSEKDEVLKVIISVLRRVGKESCEIIGMNIDDLEEEFNILTFIIYIFSDYIENGLYYSEKDSYEINGANEVVWEKTVDENIAYIINNTPYYFDYVTKETISEDNFLIQLHKYIINLCSQFIEENALIDILEVPLIRFEVNEELFSNEKFIMDRLVNAINIEYIDRKRKLLKAIYSYFLKKQELSNISKLSLFGTMDFNIVWEKVCAFVLYNKLNSNVSDIPEIDSNLYGDDVKIKDLIPFPVWKPRDIDVEINSGQTVKLDIVSIFSENLNKYFIIWDAKYYDISFTETAVKGNPGVEDIIKQYIYNLIYCDFIEKNRFDHSYNIFLFPSESSKISIIGDVEFPTIKNKLGLSDIVLIKVPDKMIYKLYLNNKKINLEEFSTLLKENN